MPVDEQAADSYNYQDFESTKYELPTAFYDRCWCLLKKLGEY
jgi:hypothetical protein